jgi:hypothetical protein
VSASGKRRITPSGGSQLDRRHGGSRDAVRYWKIVFAIAGAGHHLRREFNRFGVTAKIGADHPYDTVDAARDAFHAA